MFQAFRFLSICLLVSAAAMLPAQTRYHVNSENTNSGDGLSWSTAFRTIGAAINAASSAGGGEIWIRKSSYSETIDMVSNITLRGGFDGRETSLDQRPFDGFSVIDASESEPKRRALTVTGVNNVLIERLQLVGGKGSEGEGFIGGGVLFQDIGDSVVMDSCLIRDNIAIDGGGIAIRFLANPTIRNTTVEENVATDDGGGIYVTNQAGAMLSSLLVSDNSAGDLGGGVYTSNGSPITIIDTQVRSNSAANGGGGLSVRDSEANVSNSGFSANSVTAAGTIGGGGILVSENSLLQYSQGELLDNGGGASNSGGGLRVEDSRVELGEVIFVSNSASSGGHVYTLRGDGFIEGGYMTDGLAGGGGAVYMGIDSTVSLRNCTLFANLGILGGGIMLDGSQGEISDCVISSNETNNASGVAALEALNGATTSIDRCVFAVNKSVGDAAIRFRNAPLTVSNSLFVGNTSTTSDVGAIKVVDNDTIFQNCTFQDNTDQSANGVFVGTGANPVFQNCLFDNNGARAISDSDDLDSILRNCLFSRQAWAIGDINRSEGFESSGISGSFMGDARFVHEVSPVVYNDYQVNSYDEFSKTQRIAISDIGFPSGALIGQIVRFRGSEVSYVIIRQGSFFLEVVGPRISVSSTDDLMILDYQLQSSSLAIDRGDSSDLSFNEDLNGLPRIVDVVGLGVEGAGAIDIGAFEQREVTNVNATPGSRIYISKSATGSGDGSSWLNAYGEIQEAIDAHGTSVENYWIAAGDYEPVQIQELTTIRLYGGFREGDESLSARQPAVVRSTIKNNTTPRRSPMNIFGCNTVEIDGLHIDGDDFAPMSGGSVGSSENVTFRSVDIEGGYGGGLSFFEVGSILIENCQFEDLERQFKGSALTATSCDALDIRASRFINNFSENEGVVVHLNDVVSATIENSFFEGNRGEGGTILAERKVVAEPVLEIHDSVFMNNMERAIIARSVAVHLTGVDVLNQYATFGGSFFEGNYNGSDIGVTMDRCRVAGHRTNSTIGEPGTLVVLEGGVHEFTNSLFNANLAGSENEAARIETTEDASLRVVNCTFDDRGLGVFNGLLFDAREESTLSLINSLIMKRGSSPVIYVESAENFSSIACLYDVATSVLLQEGSSVEVGTVDGLNGLGSSFNNIVAKSRVVYTEIDPIPEDGITKEFSDDAQLLTINFPENFFEPDELVGELVDPHSSSSLLRSIVVANTANSITVLNPGEVDSGFFLYDHRPVLESLAVDNGEDQSLGDDDLAGDPRRVRVSGLGRKTLDIGAFEYQGTSLPGPVTDTIFVSTKAPLSGDGSSWSNAYRSIQQAIDDPDSATKPIWVADGTYEEALVMNSNRRLYGGFTEGDLFLDSRRAEARSLLFDSRGGDDTSGPHHQIRMVNVSDVLIDQFSFNGGRANGASLEDRKGGGIYMVNCSGNNVLRNIYFNGMTAQQGGAISARDSNVTIETIIAQSCNADSYGAVLYLEGATDATVTNADLVGGFAGVGGGAFYMRDQAKLTIRDSNIEANGTGLYGGAVTVFGGDLLIENTTMSYAFAASGGGFFHIGGGSANITLDGVVMNDGNGGSLRNGGAFYHTAGNLMVKNSVITFCSAFRGAAYYGEGGGTATFESTNFFNHSNVNSIIEKVGGSLTLRNLYVEGNAGKLIHLNGGNLEVDRIDVKEQDLTDAVLMEFEGGESILSNALLTGLVSGQDSIFSYTGGDHVIVNSTISDNSTTSPDTAAVMKIQDGVQLDLVNNIVSGHDTVVVDNQTTSGAVAFRNNLFSGNFVDCRTNQRDFNGASDLDLFGTSANNRDGDPLFAMNSDIAKQATINFFPKSSSTVRVTYGERGYSADFSGAYVSVGQDNQQVRVVSADDDGNLVFERNITGDVGDVVKVLDYRPVIGSDALDRASASEAPSIDLYKRARPRKLPEIGNDDGYDIGAIETYPQSISVSQSSVDFGNVDVTEEITIRVQNLGSFPLNFTGTRTAILSNNGGHFSIVSPQLPDLNPNSFFNVRVRFSPNSPGTKTAILLITSNDPFQPNLEIPLRGVGGNGAPEELADFLFYLLDIGDEQRPDDENSDDVLDAADIPALVD